MSSGSVPPRAETLDAEALVLAMAIAPTAYSRNRMFGIFKDPRLGRARSRASMIRSLAVELARAPDAIVLQKPVAGDRVAITIKVERLQYARNVELSQNELSALRWLCSRAKVPGFACEAEDQAVVEKVLLRLSSGLIA